MAIVDRKLEALGTTASRDERIPTIRQKDLADHLLTPAVTNRLKKVKALAASRGKSGASRPPASPS